MATESNLETCTDEERVALNCEEGVTSRPAAQPWLAQHKRGVLAAAAACLALCGTVLALTTAAPVRPTARELLERRDVQQIMGNHLLKMGHDADQEEISRAMQWKFAQLKEEKPEVLHRLETTRLSEEQVAAAHRFLRSMGDERLHNIRKDIMAAIRDTVHESGDREVLKRHLVEKLGPRAEEMRQLRDAYFPEHRNGPVDRGLPLEPKHLDRMQLVKAFDGLRAKANRVRTTHLEPSSAVVRKLQSTDDFSKMFDEVEKFFDENMGSFDFGSSSTSGSNSDPMACFQDSLAGKSDMSTCFEEAMDSVGSMFG